MLSKPKIYWKFEIPVSVVTPLSISDKNKSLSEIDNGVTVTTETGISYFNKSVVLTTSSLLIQYE